MLQIEVEYQGKKIPLKTFRNKLRILSHNFFTQDGLELIREVMVRMNIFATNPINTPNLPTAAIIFQKYFDDIVTGKISANMIYNILGRGSEKSSRSLYYPEDVENERRLLNLQRGGNQIRFPSVFQERKFTLLHSNGGYAYIRRTESDPHMVNYLLARSKGFAKKDPKSKFSYFVAGRDIVRSSVLLAAENIIRGMKHKLGGYFFGAN